MGVYRDARVVNKKLNIFISFMCIVVDVKIAELIETSVSSGSEWRFPSTSASNQVTVS